ncbi:SulP family inorganic anion transporter [Clostridium chauvoei]|uniref:SulP family inorganic anion transporter n=1 Tax=Clostridium chauvoei TaxID=46867 RepID=UPI001C8417DD|nr:SulP family inorganic anion transporter [Clostridium chauvoei]MBX7387481.1 SulP family inorganic anion transporter [Clostridium chauvoei]
MFSDYKNDLINEFKGYNLNSFKKDLMAGITVTAVALPLALAFGVSCGATAAAGLITAIIGGLVIGALSGASFQISGPTGAMSAILILLFQKYGLNGVWIAGAIAGLLLVIAGIFKFGKIVSYIPSPVVTGFTSGIALIIAIGQLDNFFGVSTKGAESAAGKVIHFLQGPLNPNWYAVLLGGVVVLTMIVWPKKWNAIVPSSLIGLILALGINLIFKLPVEVIGSIPKTLFLDDRLTIGAIDLATVKGLIVPSISIAALAMIESLLCGEVGKKMKGEEFNSNRELIAQGIGNMIIPFFGGVPATAAIARTSVAIKSGGKTRLVSVFHALFLLVSMFVLAPIMSQIPLAGLAGVLMVTAWRMNEWENIEYMFSKRFKSAISKFLITMIATVMFDLTQAILIGVIFSSLLFIVKISNIDISINEVDEDRLADDIDINQNLSNVKVAYFTGPLFFATVEKFKSELSEIKEGTVLILSMRGVPLIDTSGIQALEELRIDLEEKQCTLMLCGLQPQVKNTIARAGIYEKIGKEMIFWSADQAIVAADQFKTA